MKNVTGPGKFHPYACDVSKKDEVAKAFEHVKNTLGTVHVLVNNAGILKMQSIEDTPIEELEDIININLMGTLYCAKEAIKLMKAADHEAYIININSVAGLKTLDPDMVPGVKMYTNVYSPSKFAITALSDILTKELRDGKIRVTNLSPGYVKTNIVGDFTSNLTHMPILMSKDIADIIVYLIGLPMQVQITQLTHIKETFGTVYLLVNNAGVFKMKSIEGTVSIIMLFVKKFDLLNGAFLEAAIEEYHKNQSHGNIVLLEGSYQTDESWRSRSLHLILSLFTSSIEGLKVVDPDVVCPDSKNWNDKITRAILCDIMREFAEKNLTVAPALKPQNILWAYRCMC
ncbi:hypothetical protein TSAR_016468 [Trichomalopsis sarcophagae]|uniref:Ketoreductase (KR) domain-containing protein n=1 Tax=Trichomalopsis sarcophagae TaxID=543379 RepID=A0A232EQS4_9HYME|nr:hypothetical protein TSAR_016468 [Trichomalopsis sarcophagae]